MKNFDEIYNELKKEDFSKIEEERAKLKHKQNVCFIISIILGIVFFVIYNIIKIKRIGNLFFPVGTAYTLLGMFFAMFSVLIFYVIIGSVCGALKRLNITPLYKSRVIEKMIYDIFGNTTKYTSEIGITEQMYNEYMYEDISENFESEDGVFCEDLGLAFSEVITKKEVKDSDGDTHTVTVFCGIAGVLNLSKSINSTFKVLENGSIFKGKNKVEMDSQTFEKYFDVKAEDNILATRILTADVMLGLVELRKNITVPIEFVVQNDKIYFRIHYYKSFLEMNMNKPIIDEKTIKNSYDILYNVHKVANFLKEIVENVDV